MKKDRWSDYAKYLVLSDNSGTALKGSYVHYQSFKLVKGIINNIAYSDKSSYLYDGDIYTRKITTTDAKNILTNISLCKWNDVTKKMLLIASQIGLRI